MNFSKPSDQNDTAFIHWASSLFKSNKKEDLAEYNLPLAFIGNGSMRIPTLLPPDYVIPNLEIKKESHLNNWESTNSDATEEPVDLNVLVDEILQKPPQPKMIFPKSERINITSDSFDIDESHFLNLKVNLNCTTVLADEALKNKKRRKSAQKIKYGVEYDQEATPECLPILEGYNYSISYLPSKGPRRRKRVIYWKHPGWDKYFTKAWNFADHAKMHLGVKPYKWNLCNVKFTQKGNLKKHMKVHQF